MATKKKATSAPTDSTTGTTYEQGLEEFGAGLEKMRSGAFDAAGEMFDRIATTYTDEIALVERARMYSRHCANKLAPAAAEPQTADELFYRAVVHSNNGEADAALLLLDRALQVEPESARMLYAKASAFAIRGDAEAAVQDLRRAIAVDPQVRFQAGNDPDFELIREEPAFIDIIEPTPTGA